MSSYPINLPKAIFFYSQCINITETGVDFLKLLVVAFSSLARILEREKKKFDHSMIPACGFFFFLWRVGRSINSTLSAMISPQWLSELRRLLKLSVVSE